MDYPDLTIEITEDCATGEASNEFVRSLAPGTVFSSLVHGYDVPMYATWLRRDGDLRKLVDAGNDYYPADNELWTSLGDWGGSTFHVWDTTSAAMILTLIDVTDTPPELAERMVDLLRAAQEKWVFS